MANASYWITAGIRQLRKPNVELVTDDIRRITRDGVETVDGVVRKADIVVLATGFGVADEGSD